MPYFNFLFILYTHVNKVFNIFASFLNTYIGFVLFVKMPDIEFDKCILNLS